MPGNYLSALSDALFPEVPGCYGERLLTAGDGMMHLMLPSRPQRYQPQFTRSHHHRLARSQLTSRHHRHPRPTANAAAAIAALPAARALPTAAIAALPAARLGDHASSAAAERDAADLADTDFAAA